MKILFVCTGNTCRSPMAEALFNALPSRPANTEAFSAGLSALPDDPVSSEAVQAMKDYGIDLAGRKAVRFTAEMAREADLILTMTEFQRAMLLALLPELSDKIFSFANYLNGEAEESARTGTALTGELQAAQAEAASAGGTEREPLAFGEVEDPYGQPQLVYKRVAEQLEEMVKSLQSHLTDWEQSC